VFPLTRADVPGFVYDDSFYPDGWETRQVAR
jgi:hypothetical protein